MIRIGTVLVLSLGGTDIMKSPFSCFSPYSRFLTVFAALLFLVTPIKAEHICNPKDCPVILGETENLGRTYLEKLIFVGDSTTHHMISRGVLPGGTATKQVWTPRNGTMLLSPTIDFLKIVDPYTNEERTIAEAAALYRPPYLVLTVGLNGSHSFTEPIYKGSCRRLINAVRAASPNTKIILQSVFPVASNESAWTSVTPSELNRCIDRVNGWAKELTTEYENLRYLDTQSVLRGEDGFLQQSYQSGDGIHLTKDGYEAVLHYIQTHAWTD